MKLEHRQELFAIALVISEEGVTDLNILADLYAHLASFSKTEKMLYNRIIDMLPRQKRAVSGPVRAIFVMPRVSVGKGIGLIKNALPKASLTDLEKRGIQSFLMDLLAADTIINPVAKQLSA